MRAAATALHALGRAIALASRLAPPGRASASPPPAPRASQLSSRPCVPQVSPALGCQVLRLGVTFPPACRQGRCVGHGRARPGSRPPPFSSGRARRACREATSPLPRRPGGRRPSPAGARLDAGPEMRAAISPEAPRVTGVLPRCRDLARSDMEMSCPFSRFEVRLHKARAAPLPGLRCVASPTPPHRRINAQRLRSY